MRYYHRWINDNDKDKIIGLKSLMKMLIAGILIMTTLEMDGGWSDSLNRD